jgi:hypothetical protein
MLDTSDVRLEPPRPDQNVPAPTEPRKRRWLGPTLLAFALFVTAVVFAASRGTPNPVASPAASGGPHRYAGPQLAFDVPAGWHEFYLEVPWEFAAAYGPIEGGDQDYVAVGAVPAEIASGDPEEILGRASQKQQWTGSVTSATINGMPAATVPVRIGTIDGIVTVAEGDRDTYLLTCAYTEPMSAAVRAGCASITASLTETAAPVATDPSGCTDTELAIMRAIDLPSGTAPGPLFTHGTLEGAGHLCDVMVGIGSSGEDVAAYYTSRLEAAGWTIGSSGKDRTAVEFDVYRVVAMKDWDVYMIEIYVNGGATPSTPGATDHFFVTVADG